MTWVLILIGQLGPAVLAEDFESERACSEAAQAYKAQIEQMQQQHKPMLFCFGIAQIGIPPMEVPGKWM